MSRRMVWALTAFLAASSPAAHEACHAPTRRAEAMERTLDHKSARDHRYTWWRDDTSRAEIGLTDHQSVEIDGVWQEALHRQRAALHELDRLEAVLSKMIRENAEEPMIISQIVQVEAVRSEMRKTRTLMLYRMYRCLTTDQRARLTAMAERWRSSLRESNENRP